LDWVALDPKPKKSKKQPPQKKKFSQSVKSPLRILGHPCPKGWRKGDEALAIFMENFSKIG